MIDFQIQCSNKLGVIGGVTKIALETIAFGNQRLEQSKSALNEKIKEEQEKLEALTEFQGETSGLFQESLTQLKIGMQGVEILGFTTVNPGTGAYLLPDGFDSTWFTSAKSMSVTARRKEVVLEKSMDSLQLPEEARAYYQKIMEKVLKDVPIDQWAFTIQQLNECFLFDDEGNILAIGPLGVGQLKKIIVSKNGKYDSDLTALATSELTSEQLEAFKEDFPQLALGVMEFLTGLGINGLNLVGTYFSGGTLAMVGLSQAVAVTGSAITAGGALTIADAINKTGLASSTVSISFANSYGDRQNTLYPNGKYVPSPKHTLKGKGGWGSEMDLNVDEAQKVLNESKQLGKQKYGLKNGQLYEFQSDGAGGWHGYKVKGTELTDKKGGADILRDWLNEGKINSTQYNKLRKGK